MGGFLFPCRTKKKSLSSEHYNPCLMPCDGSVESQGMGVKLGREEEKETHHDGLLELIFSRQGEKGPWEIRHGPFFSGRP